MSLIDIIVVAILGISSAFGLKNGLVKSLVRLIGGLLSVVLAYLLCQSAVSLLSELLVIEELPLDQYLTKLIEAEISTSFVGPEGAENIFLEVPAGGYNFENVAAALTINGVPALLSGVIAPILVSLMEGSSLSLATYAAAALSGILMSALSFLLLFFIISVILNQIAVLVDKVFSLPVIGIVNRLGGLLFGLIKAVIAIWVVLFIAALIGIVSGPINALIDSTVIVKFLSDNNPLTLLVSNGLNLEQTITDLLGRIQAGE